jgi:hypothetical protein
MPRKRTIKIHWRDSDTLARGSAESVAVFNKGHSHFIVDDGCYVLVNRHYGTRGKPTDSFRPSPWIFAEAREVLAGLPPVTERPERKSA